MAVKKVRILMGQSNADGQADIASLSASLRGAQANCFIFNYENNAVETLNCDGVGANLPNNTTVHIAGWCGPEMTLSQSVKTAEGESYLFKFAIASTALGPALLTGYRSWHPEMTDLFSEFTTRWAAFVAAMALLGHTVDVQEIYWYQGEADTFIEGHDQAYFGLFKAFKKAVREFLAPYSTKSTIRWVSALIHSLLLPSGPTIFLLNRTKTVRSALLRAGWEDSEYRVIDADRYSFKTDLIHLDTQGVMDCGNDFWTAAQLTYSNTMALETYTLSALRTKIAQEFGIELNNENTARIDSRINDAILFVSNRRKNWPWLHRDTTLNVGEKSTSPIDIRYGAALFSLSQSQAFYSSWSQSPIEPRELIDFDGDGIDGMMALAYTGTTIQLRQGYTGDDQTCNIVSITVGATTVIKINRATARGGTASIPRNVVLFGVQLSGTSHATPSGTYDGYYYAARVDDETFVISVNSTGHTAVTFGTAKIAVEFTIAQGYVQLPDDFIRNDNAHIEGEDSPMTYRHPTIFTKIMREQKVTSVSSKLYTVVPDPLGIITNKFLVVYPFFTERALVYLSYWTDAKKLIGDDDVPDVPRSDMFVVLYACLWFAAQWQKDNELVAFYRDGTLNELEKMAKEYQLSDDLSESEPIDRSDYNGPVPPSGFPEFEEP